MLEKSHREENQTNQIGCPLGENGKLEGGRGVSKGKLKGARGVSKGKVERARGLGKES